MNYYLYLTTLAPELVWILQAASPTTTERQAQDLRYRVRMLGLAPTDTQIALGILADSLDGDERRAA